MNKNFKKLILIILLAGSSNWVAAQADCVLGVGLTDNNTLIDIFQMNAMQQEKLANLAAELQYRNELLNNQLENISKRDPQSTQAELMRLADKYKGIMDSMGRVQVLIDKKVLSLFNEKQYELYRSLCREASRSPFVVTPAIYNDSIPNKDR